MYVYKAANIDKKTHAFFGRQGGVSTGFYESLNFNIRSQDTPENITKNLQIVADFYGKKTDDIMRLYQDHTNIAVYVEEASKYQLKADAVITDKKDIILSITTADCVPVLFADYKNGVIGAAHAGWRGALYGVVENTIEVMLSKGAHLDNIVVAIGPCLQKKSFETKDDMRDLFIEQDSSNAKFFEKIGEGQYLCDLEKFIVEKLEKIGVKSISSSGIDTYVEEEKFFSYRRFCHQNLIMQAGDFPIHLSTICL